MTYLIARLTTAAMATEQRLADRITNRRAVSMLEYMMIAGIVLGIGILLSTVLRPAISGLITRVSDFLGSQGN
jgi:hypothetical protein